MTNTCRFLTRLLASRILHVGNGGNDREGLLPLVTVKVKDPKHLENIKAGDVVELTYTQALAVSLDKRTTP